MDSSCYVRGSARCCTLLVRHAMPRAFLTTCLSYRLLVPVFMHRVLVLCVTLIRALSVFISASAVLLCGYALQCFPTSRSLRGITRDASISPQGFYAGLPVCVCGVYSDYSYLCSNDLQTLPAYRSCNVDHGCLCSHLNPPSRFFNTSRAPLDTYIRHFLLFTLCNLFNH